MKKVVKALRELATRVELTRPEIREDFLKVVGYTGKEAKKYNKRPADELERFADVLYDGLHDAQFYIRELKSFGFTVPAKVEKDAAQLALMFADPARDTLYVLSEATRHRTGMLLFSEALGNVVIRCAATVKDLSNVFEALGTSSEFNAKWKKAEKSLNKLVNKKSVKTFEKAFLSLSEYLATLNPDSFADAVTSAGKAKTDPKKAKKALRKVRAFVRETGGVRQDEELQ